MRSLFVCFGCLAMVVAFGCVVCAAEEGAGSNAPASFLQPEQTTPPGQEASSEPIEDIEALIGRLSDPDPDTRAAAAKALGALGTKAAAAVPALIRRLDDDGAPSIGDPVWISASRALGKMGPEAVPHLIAALSNASPHVTKGAAAALGDIGPAAKDAVGPLIAELERDDPQTRITLMYALKSIGPDAEQAVPLLIKILDHDDFHAQYWACQALGGIGPLAVSATPVLCRLTSQGRPSVRRHAAAALGKIGPGIGAEGLQALVRALRDPTGPVREDAVVALGTLGDFARPAIPEILAAIENKKLTERVPAAETVWRLTHDADLTVPLLKDELESFGASCRAAALLGDLGPAAERALPQLVDSLQSSDPLMRLEAAKALGRIGPAAEASVPALQGLLQDASPDVRRAAANSIKQIQSKTTEPAAETPTAAAEGAQNGTDGHETGAAESQGIWYTVGTVENYARGRPDPSVPAERYACVYPGKPTVYSGPMATYCAWHRPMAVYAPSKNKTYFVFGNPENSPAISCYDHASGSFACPVVLGKNPNSDAHRNPTLLIDASGYLYVFYGAHGHPTRVVKSTQPYDIAAWAEVAPIEMRNTYPQPWQLNPGELFVSYRGEGGWYFQKSVDGAASWQQPVQLIEFPQRSIYLASIAETGPCPRKVHVVWSQMGGGTPEELRTKALWARRYDVYYACSDDGGTTWKRSDGTAYALPIGPEQAEQVHESGEHGVWIKDIQIDPDGHPCAVFIDCDVRTYEARWKFARCEKGRWRVSDIAASDHMYDLGGLVIVAADDYRLYAPTTAVQDHEDGGAIEEWTSRDRGKTWTNTKHLTPGAEYSHNHVKVVYNGGTPEFRVVWSYGDSLYPPATRRVTLYRYGEALTEPQPVAFP